MKSLMVIFVTAGLDAHSGCAVADAFFLNLTSVGKLPKLFLGVRVLARHFVVPTHISLPTGCVVSVSLTLFSKSFSLPANTVVHHAR